MAKTSSLAEKELDKLDEQFKAFDENVKDLTLDRMNQAPTLETEPQTKLSQKELEKSNQIYIKPFKTIGCRDKFNEKFRESYKYDAEYVNIIAENKEIIGEEIDLWTRPYPGMPAEEWKIPVNKAVWVPRYVADRIKGCVYHRLVMTEAPTQSSSSGQFYGTMAADTTLERLTARPVSNRKTFFTGSNF